MKKLSVLALLLCSSLVLAAPSFTIGGNAVSLPSVQQGGQLYVDAAAFAKALGYTLTFDKTKNTYVLQAQTPAGPTGSGQLAGGVGQPGQPYSITNNYAGQFNFTLTRAEFVATRVNIGQQSYSPAADQKLLVLHYSVQNASKDEQRYYLSSFKFTVVDDQNVNRQNVDAVGQEGGNASLDIRLKPAQKVDAYTVIALPAASSAPKLLVQGDNDTVIRYDLHGLVTPLAVPYADPKNSQAARAAVPATPGAYFQVGALDVRLDAATLGSTAIAGTAPDAGHRYLTLTLSIRNGTPVSQRLSYNNLLPALQLASGDRVNWNQNVLKAGSDDPLDVRLNPGEEARARLYFEVPTGDAPKTLRLTQETSRPIDYDVSGAK